VSAVVIASEPLTDERGEWEPVPVNRCISVSPAFGTDIRPV
jgi:predicted glutamine amidotransferase